MNKTPASIAIKREPAPPAGGTREMTWPFAALRSEIEQLFDDFDLADWRLPLGAEVPSYGDLRRRWHDPQREGVAGPSEAKLRALRTIAAEPRGSSARREAFRTMHRQLDADRRAARIAGPPVREEDPAAVAASREWAFPLHDPGSLQRLAEDARKAVFAAGVGHITR